MFLFTPSQIDQIKDQIRKENLIFILKNVGAYGLTADDKAFLSRNDIDLENIKNEYPIIKSAFQFGQWSANTEPKFAREISFDEFMKVVKSKTFLPLTEAEKYAYNAIQYDTTRDIKSLGSRLGNKLDTVISEADSKLKPKYIKIIGEKTKEAILKRSTIKELASTLYHSTDDVTRDLIRVSQYQLHTTFNIGKFEEYKRIYKDLTRYYFYVYPNSCKHCSNLYLTKGFGSKPKEFTSEELIENGSNIGRKVADWKPTIASIHPYCRCTIMPIAPWEKWSDKDKKYVFTEGAAKELIEEAKKKKAQRMSQGEIKKGDISKKIVREINTKHDHNQLIQSHYRAVNEYEKLFKQNLANSLGTALENCIKEMLKII